jgi:transposase
VDGLGNPLTFTLTAAQESDIGQASILLEQSRRFGPCTFVIADKGYDSADLRHQIVTLDAQPVIPYRCNVRNQQPVDFHLYKERHLVECFINKIKHYRRLFSRYEKLASRFLGFLHFVSALIWLR